MRALNYAGSPRPTWGTVPDPVVQEATDAVIGVDAVTICGTDLHIVNGDVPEVVGGRVLGHEAVGTDANSTLAVAEHCLRSRDRVNLIAVDKQPHLQYLTLRQARQQLAAGASVWPWAGTEHGAEGHRGEPDVVLACAGDVPTMETLAAAQLLRAYVPYLRVRVVNVVDLMALLPADGHPHGMQESAFELLFTSDREVVMAFHGYPREVHQLLHGRTRPDRFHVRGFSEQGTTTTPFDMVVRNGMSRYHLVLEALRRSARVAERGEDLARHCRHMLDRHARYIVEHLEDMPEVRHWTWQPGPPRAVR